MLLTEAAGQTGALVDVKFSKNGGGTLIIRQALAMFSFSGNRLAINKTFFLLQIERPRK